MTIQQGQLAVLQPAALRQALALLPILPSDAGMGAAMTGVAFMRTARGTSGLTPIYVQSDDAHVATVSPPYGNRTGGTGGGTDGPASLAYLLSTDAAMPLSLNGANPGLPVFVDMMVTSSLQAGAPSIYSRSGVHTPVNMANRLVIVPWLFYTGSGATASGGLMAANWAPANSAYVVCENERLRVRWSDFVQSSSADDMVPDAVGFVLLQAQNYKPAPLDYTCVAVAPMTPATR